ncbi:MAG: Hsp70 family protein, partial [Lachnospirales bacterium]
MMSFLGIDLGTTNSVGVIYNENNKEFEVVIIDDEYEILPSAVNYLEDETIIGQEAKAGAIIYNDTTVLSVKRLIGTDEKIVVGDKIVTPVDVSAKILEVIKNAAEEQANMEFKEVVITHPAYFNDRQIYETKEAGLLAGFENVILLSEPLAAAIEYGYKDNENQNILVYDLGGGTFDVCVLKVSIGKDDEKIFEELSDVGDMLLGGDDIDNELVSWLKEKVYTLYNVDINTMENSLRKTTIQRLKYEAENLKKKLSNASKADIVISPLLVYEGVPINLSIEITREEYEKLIRKYIDRTRDIMEEAIKRSGLKIDELNKVILVGGSTLIPMVNRMVGGYIKEPYNSLDPAKSVAMGAAIYNYFIHTDSAKMHIGQITRQVIGTSAIVDVKTLKRELIPLIPVGSKIPVSVTDSNFTNMIGSSEVVVDVFQWEQDKEDEKKYIGSVNITGIEKKSKIEVTYEINKNNIFEVKVKDLNRNILRSGSFDRSSVREKKVDYTEYIPFTDEVNIVFLIDTTGSMDFYIEGVKNKALEFSEILEAKGLNFNLGLIGYGDLYEKEKPIICDFTNDIEKFKSNLSKLPNYFGGDIPESTLDALEDGIDLLYKSNVDENSKNIFVLITDAPPHIPTIKGNNTKDIKQMLDDRNITCFVVANRDEKSVEAYSELIEDENNYFSMREKFFDILDG